MLRRLLYVVTALGAIHLGLLALDVNVPLDYFGVDTSQLDLLYLVFGAAGLLDLVETFSEFVNVDETMEFAENNT